MLHLLGVLCCLWASMAYRFNCSVSIVAGTGVPGTFNPNITSPLANPLSSPQGVAFDEDGNVFIANWMDDTLLKLDTNTIKIVAGKSGQPGAGPFGGNATSARIDHPRGLAVYHGQPFFSMQNTGTHQLISGVAADGTLFPFVGNNSYGCTAYGLKETAALKDPFGMKFVNGQLYFADFGCGTVQRTNVGNVERVVGTGVNGYGGGVYANMSKLDNPMDVAVCGNILYVADLGNKLIRQVDLSVRDPVLTTAAGNGASCSGPDGDALLTCIHPIGLDCLDAETLIFADQFRIRQLHQGQITTIAGMNVPTSTAQFGRFTNLLEASFCVVLFLAANPVTGDIVFSDSCHVVRRISCNASHASSSDVSGMSSSSSSAGDFGGNNNPEPNAVADAVVASVSVIGISIVLSVCGYCVWSRRRRYQLKREEMMLRHTSVVVKVVTSSEITLERVVGAGFSAEVYAARWHGTDIACKVMRQQKASVDFDREQSIHEKLPEHPRIVTFYGVCREPGKLMLLLKLMERGSIEQFLHCGKADANEVFPINSQLPPTVLHFNLQLVSQLLLDASAGVLHAHINGLIHRDVRAANVLVQIEEGIHRATLSDFGLSRFLPAGSRTRISFHVGADEGHHEAEPLPLKWCDPRGVTSHTYSQQTDVYMFGTMLLEVATRAEPFADMPLMTPDQIVRLRPQPPRDNQSCPRVWSDLMEACWHPDWMQRISMKSVNEQLRHFLDAVKRCDPTREPVAARFEVGPPAKSNTAAPSKSVYNGEYSNDIHLYGQYV